MYIYVGIPSGMFLLNSFPNANRISPEEFIDNSRADLEEVVTKFCEQYNSDTGVAYLCPGVDRFQRQHCSSIGLCA